MQLIDPVGLNAFRRLLAQPVTLGVKPILAIEAFLTIVL